MDSSPPSPAISCFQPQHHWHKDGGTSLLTIVFTLYNGEWDSNNSPGASKLGGGGVTLADRPTVELQYILIPILSQSVLVVFALISPLPMPFSTSYPVNMCLMQCSGWRTLALFVMQLCFFLSPHAVVFFLEPATHFTFHSFYLSVDEYLHITWALGFLDKGTTALPLFCDRWLQLLIFKQMPML
jgi:hypothetical protein